MSRSHHIADARFASLTYHVSGLLRELGSLEADPADLARARQIADSATPSTIGTVIHHLHILINEAQVHRAQDEIEICADDDTGETD